MIIKPIKETALLSCITQKESCFFTILFNGLTMETLRHLTRPQALNDHSEGKRCILIVATGQPISYY